MGRKVTIEIKPNGRQANACCSVLYQVPCIWCNMLHKQVRRQARYTCRRCDLLPKRNELHANDVYTQQIFEKGRHSCYAANHLLGRLSHIYYQSKYQLLSLAGSNRQRLLSQAFPCGCLLYLQCNNLRYVSPLHLLLRCMLNHQREALLNYRSFHPYSIHNACQYWLSQNLLFVCELFHKQTCSSLILLFDPIPLSRYGSSSLCTCRISRLRTPSNFSTGLARYILNTPTCRLYNNPRPYLTLLDKDEKCLQSQQDNIFQSPVLSVPQTTIPRAFRHKCVRWTQTSVFAMTLPSCRQSFSNHCHPGSCKSVQPHPLSGKSSTFSADNSSKNQQKSALRSFYRHFLFVNFSFSYNPCIILINFINYSLRFEGEITSRLEIFDFAEVPLTQNRKKLLLGRWNSVAVNPLGIDPVNRTLSNILELGWEGLSMNISPCAAPSKFRSLTPALRVETMGGGNLAEFPLNVRQNKNAPAIRTGMGLQGHVYVVPKPSYLFYAIATLTLNQKALQRYRLFSNPARNVNFILTFKRACSELRCRKIAAMRKSLCHNTLCAKSLRVNGYKFVVLNVVGSSPTGHPAIKPVDYQIVSGCFCTQNRPNPP